MNAHNQGNGPSGKRLDEESSARPETPRQEAGGESKVRVYRSEDELLFGPIFHNPGFD